MSDVRERFRQCMLDDFRTGHGSVIPDVLVDLFRVTRDHAREAPHVLSPFLTHGGYFRFELRAQLFVLPAEKGELLGGNIRFGFYRQSSVMYVVRT